MFLPDDVFSALYADHIDRYKKPLIESRFKEIATDCLYNNIDPAFQHLSRAQGNRLVTPTRTGVQCSICIVRLPVISLSCLHEFCSNCISKFYPTKAKRAEIKECLICYHHTQKRLLLKPSTAGIRKLEINGQSAEEIVAFLRTLKHTPALSMLPLHEYFDCVQANGVGKYRPNFYKYNAKV